MPVTNRLYALSGNQCAFPGCANPVTHHDSAARQPVTVGQQAHIVGLGRQGPRSKASPLSNDPNAIENLLLLCPHHHRIVDENPRIYSVEVLAKFKADHEAKMAAPEPAQSPAPLAHESIDLSLLPVLATPTTVWKARSRLATSEEIGTTLPKATRQQVFPFVLSAGNVWAFHDLSSSDGPFAQAVDPPTSIHVDAATLLASPDRNKYVWLLNAAMRGALGRREVRHDKERDRYYFLADPSTVTRKVVAETKTGRRQTAKKVVRQEGERSGNLRPVWWHLAAQLRLEEFCPGIWGLTIRPEFHLTADGREPFDPVRVGPRVTRRKSRMYNEGYFDAVHFWRYFLLEGQNHLVIQTGTQTITIGGDFPSIDAFWPSIKDRRFDPSRMLRSKNEDDVLDAAIGTMSVDSFESEWGAEHSDEDE